MTSIESQLAQIDWKNHDAVITFYESNRLYFDNAGIISSEEKVNESLSVTLRYADALFQKSQLDKALEALGRMNELLPKLDQKHWNYAPLERHARFLKGMILGQKQNYKKAYPIFKQLLQEDPDHHYYKVWHDHTKLGLYNWIFNGLIIFGTVMIFADALFALNKKLPFDPGLCGLVIIVLSFCTQKAVREYLKRKNKSR